MTDAGRTLGLPGFSMNDIQTAIFEYNGRLMVLPVSDKRPMNPKDVNITPEVETICTEVIMDGRILEGNLSRMGLNTKFTLYSGE